MINCTTTINFKGITLTLQFGEWAVVKFADEVSKLTQACPDLDFRSFSEVSAATILTVGYWNHCFETKFPRVYNWVDFYYYVKPKMVTRLASEELRGIFNLFVSVQDEYLKAKNNVE